LTDLLGLAEFGDAPVRQLSLGQRMRCEFAAALLHQPSLVLLDEPTIGLDFDAQAAIRGFIQRYVADHNACVLLTSHYLTDIEALAGRVVVMAQGRLAFEGSLAELRGLQSDRQVIALAHDGTLDAARVHGAVPDQEIVVAEPKPGEVTVSAPRSAALATLTVLGTLPGVTGLSLSDPPLEAALAQFYSRGGGSGHE
jgi:ABC-2 type transport system ATP-binding protein